MNTRFLPDALHLLRAAREQARSKLNCPKCQQRLQNPQPQDNRTNAGMSPPETETRGSSAQANSSPCSPSSPPSDQAAHEQWFYARDKQRVGPMSFQQMQHLAATGQLMPSDMVHRDGLAKWVAAGSLPGLFPVTTSAGPSSGTANGADNKAQAPKPGGDDGNQYLYWAVVFGVIVLIGVPHERWTGAKGYSDYSYSAVAMYPRDECRRLRL